MFSGSHNEGANYFRNRHSGGWNCNFDWYQPSFHEFGEFQMRSKRYNNPDEWRESSSRFS